MQRNHNKLIHQHAPKISPSELSLPRETRRTLAHLRTNKSPILISYLHKVDETHHPSPICPLCKTHPHTNDHLFNCTHLSYLRTYPMTSCGRRGAITDLLTTSRHPFRSFDTLRDSAARRQVQSLILSSHRFLWPPLLLPPLTVPCMIVFERPEDLETWPYYFSFLILTVVSKSSYGPMARSILLRTSTFVMCSVYDMLRSLR